MFLNQHSSVFSTRLHGSELFCRMKSRTVYPREIIKAECSTHGIHDLFPSKRDQRIVYGNINWQSVLINESNKFRSRFLPPPPTATIIALCKSPSRNQDRGLIVHIHVRHSYTHPRFSIRVAQACARRSQNTASHKVYKRTTQRKLNI